MKAQSPRDGRHCEDLKAMKDAGIPEDVGTGWVVKALEDLKAKNIGDITNIPWNGVNN